MGGDQDFKGKGEAEQSNRLSGEITVTVAQVFANGTMLVRGQKQLTLNRGDESIQISGLVRPADITPDNRVASTRVADAKHTYSGKAIGSAPCRERVCQKEYITVYVVALKQQITITRRRTKQNTK